MEETKVLTVVFTDIKGFTERTSNSDRAAVSRLLKKHEELLLPVVKSYDGILIKTIGDAFLLTFASPTNAVLCAVMMQEKLKEFNSSVEQGEKIEIRIAMNTGEVILRDGDVYGEPVNIAARIESLTEANEIWFSESTYLAMNRQEVPTSLLGEYRLKGIPEAIRVYRVVRDDSSELYSKTVKSQLEKFNSMLAEGVILQASARKTRISYLLVIAILLATALFFFSESEHDKHLRLAKEAFHGNDFRGSLESLKKAVALQPASVETSELIVNSINQHVKKRLNGNNKNQSVLNELETFISETKASFSSLDSRLLTAELDLAIAQAEVWAEAGQKQQADVLLDSVGRRSEGNAHAFFTIASFYSRFGYNWTKTMHFLAATFKLDPQTYKNHPVVMSELEWYLSKVSPDDGYQEIRSYIENHCYENFAPLLQQSLYLDGAENHTLRWNARDILSRKGAVIDDVRFFVTDLFSSQSNLNSQQLKTTLQFFIDTASDPVKIKEIEAFIATRTTSMNLFDNYHFDTDHQIMQVVSGPLFVTLKPYLLDRLHAERTHQRLNSFNALSMVEQPDHEKALKYHLINLVDFKSMQWSRAYQPYLLDSIDYLISAEKSGNLRLNEDLGKLGRLAMKASIDLEKQLKKSVDEGQETPYLADGTRKFSDFERLAAFFRKNFNENQ